MVMSRNSRHNTIFVVSVDDISMKCLSSVVVHIIRAAMSGIAKFYVEVNGFPWCTALSFQAPNVAGSFIRSIKTGSPAA